MIAIDNNINLQEGSFIIDLHERSIFNIGLLEDLILDIVSLVKKSENNISDSEILNYFQGLFFIHNKINKYIVCHFDPDDILLIKNLPENYHIYLDRLSFCLEMLLKKDYKRLSEYYDDLGKLIE